MKKIMAILALFVLLSMSVQAIGWSWSCLDGICTVTDYYDESNPLSPDYCAPDCSTCEDQGYLMPPDCTSYGYYEECDSCCPDGSFPARAEVEDFCTGYGFIRPEDCDVADCPDACDDAGCRGLGYITYGDCPDCYGTYEHCDSCCPQCPTQSYQHSDDEEPWPWWLLVVGFGIGYVFKKKKKR